MKKIALAIHGGAGEDSEFIRSHINEYESALKAITEEGYKMLSKGAAALDVVEHCVAMMEDNTLFNCGRGAALNELGKVEMDASIMDGKTLNAGGLATVNNIKNPIKLSRYILEHSEHIIISGPAALQLAKEKKFDIEPDSYFITDLQVNEYLKTRKGSSNALKDTVGAVAMDEDGNLAAATSTGGTCNKSSGRVGDSCMIGAGCYANNQTCAVSGTGDGELLIRKVAAHTVSMLVELTGCSIQQACDQLVFQRIDKHEGDVGVISIDSEGNIGMAFNSERMHRCCFSYNQPLTVNIYPNMVIV